MTEPALPFLNHLHPYDRMPETVRETIAQRATLLDIVAGTPIYHHGERQAGLYIILDGKVAVNDPAGNPVSVLQRGNSFGERGLMRDGLAATTAIAEDDSRLILLPSALFFELRAEQEPFRQFFERGQPHGDPNPVQQSDLTSVLVADLMVRDPICCTPEITVTDAARTMTKDRISCLCVVEADRLVGVVTQRDLVGKALAGQMAHDSAVAQIMTPDPRTLPPSAIGSDVLHMMVEHRLGHLPIVEDQKLVGIVTQTDLTRFQASNTAGLVADAARADCIDDLARVTGRIPQLLLQLVAAGNRHDVVTRMITDVADVVTRRLLRMAEDKLGPAPARYLWLACGSQGRQEQTGVSDQDNCLILEDGVSDAARAYFADFAKFVSDGLDACGYVYCPGDMMATNPRWCQPVSVWRAYFQGWITSPSREAQMLASVMFDLRAIGGDTSLFDGLQSDTLKAAASNSIFTAHMARNSLTHQTPLGLLRGFATIRSGENRNTIDMKLNGVVPVVDLGRMYALKGTVKAVNTRARLQAALGAKIVSASGGRDLMDAYDLVAQTRLEHQARLIKKGKTPDNFLPPDTLSDFDRSHLRDAFVVIKTMQSALMQGRGVLG